MKAEVFDKGGGAKISRKLKAESLSFGLRFNNFDCHAGQQRKCDSVPASQPKLIIYSVPYAEEQMGDTSTNRSH